MNRLVKQFAIQTLVVAVVAIPVSLYLRSDYREFTAKQQLAWRVPSGVGAVCRDGWYSGSTGSGTCSWHGGVKYWGAELRRIAQTSWPAENSLLFFILSAGLIAWYGYGVRALHRKHINTNEPSKSSYLQRQCCTESFAEGLRFCSECGAVLTNASEPAAVSPAVAYSLVTVTVFLTIGLAIIGILYFRKGKTADIAAAVPTPTASPTPTPSPTSTPTPKPTPSPEDDLNLDSGLIEPDPLEEAVRTAKQEPPPTPEPSLVAARERVVSSPTPRRIIYPESLVDASDVLSAGYTRAQDSRLYRFHLSQTARVKGSFSARGNISVYIVGGYYSSRGAISSDTIDVTLSPGTYEVVVSSREIVGFSLHLKAYYDQ